MKRVAVIGCIASGKSTSARQIGFVLDLPVTHLDRLWRQHPLSPPTTSG
jgi:adenylate kinase family enzyme